MDVVAAAASGPTHYPVVSSLLHHITLGYRLNFKRYSTLCTHLRATGSHLP